MIQGIHNQSAPDIEKKVLENKITLKCSKCGTDLVDVIQTGEDIIDEPITLQGRCGLCGDHSFEIKIDGLFKYSECDPPKVRLVDIDMVHNNKFIFLTGSIS
jgi:Zn finger protein HypA/HybF involved in hydrogenase expression